MEQQNILIEEIAELKRTLAEKEKLLFELKQDNVRTASCFQTQ